MISITEADHDAVDWLYEMGVIAPRHLRLANEAFACHREQAERQAADRIEALEAENERLREAMRDAITEIETGAPLTGSDILSAALGAKQ